MSHNRSVYSIYLLYCYLSMSSAYITADDNSENDTSSPYLKLNKEGVKVYIYKSRNSDFATFKAITHINASLDTLLAIMLDIPSSSEWLDSCKKSLLIKKISFNELYHYQIFSIPFPFQNRDFMLHSTMRHDPVAKTINITVSAAADFCRNKPLTPCVQVNKSNLVRVYKSIGTFKLEEKKQQTKITWIQHTDPAGSLPGWLINQLIENTAYISFKNLEKMAAKKQYQYARLKYDTEGIIVGFHKPVNRRVKKPELAKRVKGSDNYPGIP